MLEVGDQGYDQIREREAAKVHFLAGGNGEGRDDQSRMI